VYGLPFGGIRVGCSLVGEKAMVKTHAIVTLHHAGIKLGRECLELPNQNIGYV